ncbi:3241_t:CDS:1, partial [Dentiscutata heterogama]
LFTYPEHSYDWLIYVASRSNRVVVLSNNDSFSLTTIKRYND